MPAFAILPPRRTGGFGLFGVYRNDFEVGGAEEEVEFASCGLSSAGFKDDSGFDHRDCRNQATFSLSDLSNVGLALRLVEEEGYDRGAVDYHLFPKAFVVVSKDLIGRARIEFGKRRDAADDFMQPPGLHTLGATAIQPHQPLFKGVADGGGDGFSNGPGYLTRQSLCFLVLDAEGQGEILFLFNKYIKGGQLLAVVPSGMVRMFLAPRTLSWATFGRPFGTLFGRCSDADPQLRSVPLSTSSTRLWGGRLLSVVPSGLVRMCFWYPGLCPGLLSAVLRDSFRTLF